MSAGNPVAPTGKCTAGPIKPMGELRMKPTTTVRWVSALPHVVVSAKQVHSPSGRISHKVSVFRIKATGSSLSGFFHDTGPTSIA